jgi:uncharacterized protein YqjF (DUF2071 family)
MKLPVIQGVIRRRILANFRVDPGVMQSQLPRCFKPKQHRGFAVAGICLIRLESIRPRKMPKIVGVSSENAAHRVAVLWDEGGKTREGVFIARRDTSSTLNHLLGGRVFPGEHHQAAFEVSDSGSEIKLSMKSSDGSVALTVEGVASDRMPEDSIFSSLAEASAFFEGGSLGYSVTRDPKRLDGLRLETRTWRVTPLEVKNVFSTYFSDETKFPKGSIAFDHALLMRDIAHEWHSVDDLDI